MTDPALADSTSLMLCQMTQMARPVNGNARSCPTSVDPSPILIEENVGRLVTKRPSDLKAHPSLVSRGLLPSEKQLIEYERHRDCLYERPAMINQKNEIIDGYPAWLLACRQKRTSLICLEFRLDEKETVQRLIRASQHKPWLNSFNRGELALECEPLLRARAQENQSVGGRLKDLSKLTEDTRLDSRKQIAAIAFLSEGSLNKVKEVLKSKNRELIEAARNGEISIHRAWEYSKLPKCEQEARLGWRRARRASRARTRRLLSSHVPALDQRRTIVQTLAITLSEVRKVEQLSRLWPLVDKLLKDIQHSSEIEGAV